MRLFFLLFVALLPSIYGYSQKVEPSPVTPDYANRQEEIDHYLNKARKQRTGGLILGIGGGTLMLIGLTSTLLVGTVEVLTLGYNDVKNTFGNTCMITGLLAGIGSIPLFISAGKNRALANAMIYSDRSAGPRNTSHFPGTASSGIRIVVHLGK